MTHTAECVRLSAQQEQAARDWGALWPNYCRECGGHGQFHYSGTYWEPPTTDPCETCTFEGICARCGEKGMAEDTGEGPCCHCGWNYDDARPELYDCGCYELVLTELNP